MTDRPNEVDGTIYVPSDNPDGKADWIAWLDAGDIECS